MYAERVEVFHRSNGEAMVVSIADNLELNLFPAFERLLHEHLRSESECAACQFLEHFLILADARTEPAERVCRAYHHRVAYFAGRIESVIHVFHGLAYRGFKFYLIELLHE